jgi:hypothetical protein
MPQGLRGLFVLPASLPLKGSVVRAAIDPSFDALFSQSFVKLGAFRDNHLTFTQPVSKVAAMVVIGIAYSQSIFV